MDKTLGLVSAVSAFAFVAATPALAANFTYTVINPSGVTTLATTGINDSGQVSGYYTDPTTKKQICFIYQNGQFTTVPPPKPSSVFNTSGISPAGTVIGYDTKGTEPYEFTPGNSKSDVLKGYPKGAKVAPYSINASGAVTGSLHVSDVTSAFIDVGGKYTLIKPQGSNATIATWINSSGAVAGYYAISRKKSNGFIYDNGTLTIVKPPKAYTATFVNYLEDNGDYAGFFGQPNYDSIGFTVIGGQTTTYQFPGAGQTSVVRALSTSENFGGYSMSSSVYAYHYLNGTYYTLQTPYPTARLSGVNASGSFAGNAFDNNNNEYGFVATCSAGPGQCTQ